jgi:hypothetical protein
MTFRAPSDVEVPLSMNLEAVPAMNQNSINRKLTGAAKSLSSRAHDLAHPCQCCGYLWE